MHAGRCYLNPSKIYKLHVWSVHNVFTNSQFDLGSLLAETVTSDGLCLLGRNDSSTNCDSAASTTSSILLGPSGWMGLKHWIVKDLKTIATGMNDSYKMIMYNLMHIRMFYATLQAEEQLKMCV